MKDNPNLADALREAHSLVDLYIVGKKRVTIRVAALRHLLHAIDAADDYRDRLHDVVMVDAEARAVGGGPGFKERSEAAWRRAREPFEP